MKAKYNSVTLKNKKYPPIKGFLKRENIKWTLRGNKTILDKFKIGDLIYVKKKLTMIGK